jgi:type IV secretory pathway TrbL component
LARITPVAWARLRRCWVLASASLAALGNFGIPMKVAVVACSGPEVGAEVGPLG